MEGHSDRDLWPPKFNVFTLYFNRKVWSNFEEFQSGLLRTVSWLQNSYRHTSRSRHCMFYLQGQSFIIMGERVVEHNSSQHLSGQRVISNKVLKLPLCVKATHWETQTDRTDGQKKERENDISFSMVFFSRFFMAILRPDLGACYSRPQSGSCEHYAFYRQYIHTQRTSLKCTWKIPTCTEARAKKEG